VSAARRIAALVVAGVTTLVGLPAAAAGSGGDVAFTGVRVGVSAAAVVDPRSLARVERLRRRLARPDFAEGEVPEPQERAEPNVRATVQSPFAPLALQASTSALPTPYVSASFLAETDAPPPPPGTRKRESPPDTNGAVGRDKLMVPLNSSYVIERKSDGAVLSTVSMTSFWAAVGARNPFDPRVLYDPYSNRWLASAADDPLLPSSLILYGISGSADPQGRWHLYALDTDVTGATWADFPTPGFDQSTVAIGVNMFESGGLTYVRGRLIVLDYPSLRAGGDGRPVDVSIPGGFALQPAVTYSPTEATLYLVEHLGSLSASYRFWSLNASRLTLIGGAPKLNQLGPWSTPGPLNLLPQQDGGGIDSGDSRVGNAVFRNGHVYYAQTIGLPPGPSVGSAIRTAVQWGELDTTGAFVQEAESRTRARIPGTAATPTRSRRSPSTRTTTSSSASPISSRTISPMRATPTARGPTRGARCGPRSRSRTARGPSTSGATMLATAGATTAGRRSTLPTTCLSGRSRSTRACRRAAGTIPDGEAPGGVASAAGRRYRARNASSRRSWESRC
jgi:hypothetical protein